MQQAGHSASGATDPTDVLRLEDNYKLDVESLAYVYHPKSEINASYKKYRCPQRVQAARLIIGAGLSLKWTQIDGTGKTNIVAFFVLLGLIENPPVRITHVREPASEKHLLIEVTNHGMAMKYLTAFVYFQYDVAPLKETTDKARIAPPHRDQWWWSWARLINNMIAYTFVSDDHGTDFRPMRQINVGVKPEDRRAFMPTLMKIVIDDGSGDKYLVNLARHCDMMLKELPNPHTLSPHMAALRLLFFDEQTRLFINRELDDPQPGTKLYRNLNMVNDIIDKQNTDIYGVHNQDAGRTRIFVVIEISAPHHLDIYDDVLPDMHNYTVIVPLVHNYTDNQGEEHNVRVNAYGVLVELNEQRCVVSASLPNHYRGKLVSTARFGQVELLIVNKQFPGRKSKWTDALKIPHKRLRVNEERQPRRLDQAVTAGGFVTLKPGESLQWFGKKTGRFYKVVLVAPHHYPLVRAGVTQFTQMEIMLYDRKLRPGEQRLRVQYSVPVIIRDFDTSRCVLLFEAPTSDCTPLEHPVSVVDPDNGMVNLMVCKTVDSMKNVRRVLDELMLGVLPVSRPVEDLLTIVKYRHWSNLKLLNDPVWTRLDDDDEDGDVLVNEDVVENSISEQQFMTGNDPCRVLIGPPASGKTRKIVELACGKVAAGGCKALLVAPDVVSEECLLDMVGTQERVVRVVTSSEYGHGNQNSGKYNQLLIRSDMFAGEEWDVQWEQVDLSLFTVCDDAQFIVGTAPSLLALLRIWRPPSRIETIVCFDDCSSVPVGIACSLLTLGHFSTIVMAGDPRLLGPKNYSGIYLVPESVLDLAIQMWPTAMLPAQKRSSSHVAKVWKSLYYNGVTDSSNRTVTRHERVSNAVQSLVPGVHNVVPLFKSAPSHSAYFEEMQTKLVPTLSSCNYGEALSVLDLVRVLLRKGVKHWDIVIVSNYAGQRILIDDMLRKDGLLVPHEMERLVRVRKEYGIIVLCADAMNDPKRRRPLTIYSPGHSSRSNRFASASRMASAMTRATDELIVVVDAEIYHTGHSDNMWNELDQDSVHEMHIALLHG